ncbi:hypothetical protein ACFFX0_29735 [Citricoccus parietis]|uniref:Uncharacterized protein n=1 Tax=Citricoccus parietis TaxID=592307 RepID=A0ABV5G9K0_9MICC
MDLGDDPSAERWSAAAVAIRFASISEEDGSPSPPETTTRCRACGVNGSVAVGEPKSGISSMAQLSFVLVLGAASALDAAWAARSCASFQACEPSLPPGTGPRRAAPAPRGTRGSGPRARPRA